MNLESGVSAFASFIGGGFVAAILNWIRSNKAEKTARRVELLTSQLLIPT